MPSDLSALDGAPGLFLILPEFVDDDEASLRGRRMALASIDGRIMIDVQLLDRWALIINALLLR
jgi:hypothetical protein